MRPPRILVAGVGNIFFGDDAFGCEVVAAFAREELPAGVTMRDFGIRSYDLAYALVDGFDAAILIDAVARSEPPGTLCLMELEAPKTAAVPAPTDGHSLHPAAVLRLASGFGTLPPRLYLLGCEPATLGGDEGAMGLSPAVRAAVPAAAAMLRKILSEMSMPAAGTAVA